VEVDAEFEEVDADLEEVEVDAAWAEVEEAGLVPVEDPEVAKDEAGETAAVEVEGETIVKRAESGIEARD
jgi:hypothetical protein